MGRLGVATNENLRLNFLQRKLKPLMWQVLDALAKRGEDFVRLSMTGPHYKARLRGRRREFEPSQPRHPPHTRHPSTGLRAEIDHWSDRAKNQAYFGSNVEYDWYLETGTEKMDKRPHYKPALARVAAEAKGVIVRTAMYGVSLEELR